MANNEQHIGLEADLGQAIDELHMALQSAADAAASIKSLLPRISAIGSLFEEIDAAVRSGRRQIGAVDALAGTPAVYTRPTLVVPTAAPQPFVAESPSPAAEDASKTWAASVEPGQGEEYAALDVARAAAAPGLICFRLEFESNPGPLDLRTVDDAVSEHPAVRDVALLDYDGRKATLKVWIDGESASPSDVQQSLLERSPAIFDSANDVTILALEDVA